MDNFVALNMVNVGFMQFLVEAEQVYNDMVEHERERRRRTCWIRSWLKPERRIAVGHYHQLMEELRIRGCCGCSSLLILLTSRLRASFRRLRTSRVLLMGFRAVRSLRSCSVGCFQATRHSGSSFLWRHDHHTKVGHYRRDDGLHSLKC